MKFYSIIAILIITSFSCKEKTDKLDGPQDESNAGKLEQTGDVPIAVKSNFNEKFPGATDIAWEMEGEIFEAEFDFNGEELEAEFYKNGKWIMTEREIKVEELPEAVLNSINSNYEGFEIKEAEAIELFDFGNAYEVEVEKKKGDKEMEIIIDPEGNILEINIEGANDSDED